MKNIIVILFALLITACGSTPTTKVDYNEETNFSSFKSFQFIEHASTSVDANPIMLNRIENAVKNTLTHQSLTFNENQADLQVTVHFVQQEKANNSSFSIGFGGSKMGNHRSTGVGVSTSIPISSDATIITTIVVDISNANKAVWHGSDSYEGKGDMSTEEKQNAINETVNRLLANFPPKKAPQQN